MGVRINEHKKAKIGITATHRLLQKHDFNWDNFYILDKESNESKRLISEMIHINLQKNAINKKDDTQNLNNFYLHFLNEIKYL